MGDATVAETLAAFAAALDPAAVPHAVRAKARLHLLDCLGCAVAAAGSDFASASFAAFRRLEGGTGSVAIGRAETLGLRDAVAFNAGLAHALDYDDTHGPTLNHVTAAGAPLALALAARQGATRREALAACIVAAETGARIGLAAPGDAFIRRGFHPTGVLNAFGCALGAGKLLGLDAPALAAAQGIALSMAAGGMEWRADGAWTKRLHPGLAAAGGLTAAAMAAEGVTAPARPYEGEAGLYRLLLGPEARPDLAAVTDGLGTRWEIARLAIKPYPLVHHLHGVIECALAIARDDAPRAEDIVEITAFIAAPQVPLLCEPEAERRAPANGYAGLFSLYHSVAVAVARGRMTLDEADDALLADPAIRRLRALVRYEIDPDSAFPAAFSGGIRVRLADGRVLERHERHHAGSVERPLPDDVVIEKFRANAGRLYRADRVEAILDATMTLDDSPDGPAALCRLLGAP